MRHHNICSTPFTQELQITFWKKQAFTTVPILRRKKKKKKKEVETLKTLPSFTFTLKLYSSGLNQELVYLPGKGESYLRQFSHLAEQRMKYIQGFHKNE